MKPALGVKTMVGTLLCGVVLSMLAAGPARASCAPMPSVAQAYADNEVVFKGTVLTFANNTAEVRVDEVWKGPPLAETVTVITGAVDDDPNDDSFVASSVDRSVKEGVTYLFFPTNDDDPFKDNICTATQRYDPSLERLREPSQTEHAAGPGETGGEAPVAGTPVLPRTGMGSMLLVWTLVAWVAMALGAWILFLRRNRSRPPS